MGTFAKIPKATLAWEGMGWYGNGYSHTQEYELVLKRKDKNDVRFGDYVLSYDEAYELYTDLVGATLAVVVQKGSRKHAVDISTVVRMTVPNPVGNEDLEVPEHKIAEIIEWLRFVLGIVPYTDSPETWEY